MFVFWVDKGITLSSLFPSFTVDEKWWSDEWWSSCICSLSDCTFSVWTQIIDQRCAASKAAQLNILIPLLCGVKDRRKMQWEEKVTSHESEDGWWRKKHSKTSAFPPQLKFNTRSFHLTRHPHAAASRRTHKAVHAKKRQLAIIRRGTQTPPTEPRIQNTHFICVQ